MAYRPRELWLLLGLAVALGIGLAVREFKNGFPEMAERWESLDAEAPPDEKRAGPVAPFPPRPPKLSQTRTTADARVDLNRATVEELQRLPGIGATLAGQIVRTRERRGRFATAEELLAVPGMGPKKLDRIRDLVTVQD